MRSAEELLTGTQDDHVVWRRDAEGTPVMVLENDDGVELMPLEKLRAYGLPATVKALNLDAAAVFAEALKEFDAWLGGPVEISIDYGVIVSDAFKVVGAMMAGVDSVPVVDKDFETLDAVEQYAAVGEPSVWRREDAGDPETPIGQIPWSTTR